MEKQEIKHNLNTLTSVYEIALKRGRCAFNDLLSEVGAYITERRAKLSKAGSTITDKKKRSSSLNGKKRRKNNG